MSIRSLKEKIVEYEHSPKTQILGHLEYLIEHTAKLQTVTSFLTTKAVLTNSEEETIFGMVENQDKCEIFYRTLCSKGPQAFLYLIQSLIFSENDQAAKILTENYKRLVLGGNPTEVYLFKFSDTPQTLKTTLTSLELVFVQLHRNDLESFGHLTKLQELKLLNIRLFGKRDTTWITKPELRDLKKFHYEEEIPFAELSSKSSGNEEKSLKSVFFFSTKNVDLHRMDLRIVIAGVVYLDTGPHRSDKNPEMCLMSLQDVANDDEQIDVWLTYDRSGFPIEIQLKNCEVNARCLQLCLMNSQKFMEKVQTFQMENCRVVGEFQSKIRVTWPKLKYFYVNIRVSPDCIKKSMFFEKIFFFNKFWDIPWALDEIYSLNVNIRVLLNGLYVCGVDHSQPSLNFINRGLAECSEALLESVRNQQLLKVFVISTTQESQSRILSWNQNIQPHLLKQLTFVGPYTASFSTLLKKCDNLSQISIWNKRETLSQKIRHSSLRCGVGVTDSLSKSSDSFELQSNFTHVALFDLIICYNSNNSNNETIYDRLEQLHLYECNADAILSGPNNRNLQQIFPALREFSIDGVKSQNQSKPDTLKRLLEIVNLESILICKFQWTNKANELTKELLRKLAMKGNEKNFVLGKVPAPITRKSEIPQIVWKSRVLTSQETQQILYNQFRLCDYFADINVFAKHANLYGLKTRIF